jgi:RNA polymerase sigma-70 factor (ECF subfamily)
VQESPEALMAAYQGGDRDAADALIDSLSPALHRYFASYTGDRRHADDLLQETWLRIHKARHTWRPGDLLLPWVYAVARHVKVDAYRRRRFEDREQPLASVPEPATATRTAPDLDALLACLPGSQREVVSMLKVAGLSLEEVARATSSSVGSVKQKAHRAYATLRAVLGGQKGAP